MDYDTVDAEVRELAHRLSDPDDPALATETERLTALAEQIEDDVWRQRALARVRRLPDLVAGPQTGASPQYAEASALVADAIAATGSPAERIAEAERTAAAVAALADHAPVRESLTILRMNSTLARLIEELRIEEQRAEA
jgi:hypothetical protein